MDTEKAKFISFEYKKIKVNSNALALYLDAYENFGWILDERLSDLHEEGIVTLQLRRDRKIINRMELTRLQRNFEGCMEEIFDLEKAKTQHATAAAITVGILGTAFLAGATFAATALVPMIGLCVLLALPGFAGWILPYFLFQYLKKKKEKEIQPLIEKKEEEIRVLMEKGHSLL